MIAAHCLTCVCGRRAPVQANRERGKGPGTVSWEEHLLAWSAYAARYGKDQSAERIAERAGFCYGELCDFLGREPSTWAPRGAGVAVATVTYGLPEVRCGACRVPMHADCTVQSEPGMHLAAYDCPQCHARVVLAWPRTSAERT